MRRSFPAGVHRAGASRTCHPGRYAALPSSDPIHNFRSYLAQRCPGAQSAAAEDGGRYTVEQIAGELGIKRATVNGCLA
jgi:hypothetical protein